MRKRVYLILMCILAALIATNPAGAQEEQLTLGLKRVVGYSGFGNDIQGQFSMEILNTPANLVRVEFTIDGKLLAEDNEAPFFYKFSTDSHALGEHVLSAIGYTADGQSLSANAFTREFVSAEAGWQAALKIVGPILGIVVAVLVLSFVLSFLTGKKQAHIPPGTPRNYGFKGGAICPKCQRPFAFQLLALNMGLFHKADRCPHCGRWGLVRRKSLEELRAAEAAELAGAQATRPVIPEEDRMKKELEDSRYQNL